MSPPDPTPPPAEPHPSFQFSLATLMGAMTLVVVAVAVVFVLPDLVGIFVACAVGVAWVAFLAAGAFFGKRAAQTFCIGAIAAHWLARPEAEHYTYLYGSLVNIVGVILADAFAGWVCVRARRYWEQRDQ